MYAHSQVFRFANQIQKILIISLISFKLYLKRAYKSAFTERFLRITVVEKKLSTRGRVASR